MSTRLGGIIGCKYKTSSWYLNGFPMMVVTLGQQYNIGEKPTVILCVCVCVCVFFPFILDIKFVGRASRGHTGGRSHRISHPPSFCGARLFFLARRIQPFLSLVDREVEFCVLTIESFSTHWAFLFSFFSFSVRKIPFAGIELTSQRVRGYMIPLSYRGDRYTYINRHAGTQKTPAKAK